MSIKENISGASSQCKDGKQFWMTRSLQEGSEQKGNEWRTRRQKRVLKGSSQEVMP